MLNSRAQLADALRPLLPSTWDVFEQARQGVIIDPTTPAVVMVQRLSIEPAPNAQGSYRETIAIWLLDPSNDMSEVDDNLDEHLEQLLDALDQLPALTWLRSDRDIFDPDSDSALHAYRTDITLNSTKE